MSSATPNRIAKDFISARAAARLIGCRIEHIPILADSGRLGVLEIPGLVKRYALVDCERVRDESRRPATV